MDNKEYIDIIEKAKSNAINCLKNFFCLLDLDSELFNHLYNINIHIQKTYLSDSQAEYVPNTNTIILNEQYLKNIMEIFKNDPEKNEKINLLVTKIILHETIHANRTIMIENGFNELDSKKIIKKELYNLTNKDNKDYENCVKALQDIINKEYIKDFKRYIPVKVNFNSDDTYSITAYNIKTKNFLCINNQKFKTKYNGDIDNFLKNIGKEINNSDFKITGIIKHFKNTKDNIKVASDFYHPYEERNSLIKKNDGISPNASSIYNNIIIKKIEKEAIERINNSYGFEEILTNTLAFIIAKAKDEKTLDLDKMIKNAEKYLTLDEKIMTNVIKKTGKEMLIWYFTSVYDDQYIDYFEKLFKENYDKVLYDFSDLYDNLNENIIDVYSDYEIKELNNIINKK